MSETNFASASLTYGFLYFVLAFGAGWVLGPIREFLVVPRMGHAGAHLAEAPVMIMVSWLAARCVVTKAQWPGFGTRIGIGLSALCMLLAAETAGVRLVRGLSVAEYLAQFTAASGAATAGTYFLFAAMPLVTARTRGARRERR